MSEEIKNAVALKESSGEHSSHHHSHGEHHHHHHHHTKKKKLLKKIKKHETAYKIVATVLAVALIVGVAVVADRMVFSGRKSNSGAETANRDDKLVYIGVPMFSTDVEIANEVVRDYYDSDVSVRIEDVLVDYKDEEIRLDVGRSATVAFDVNYTPDGVTVRKAVLDISETSDFKDAVSYDLDSDYTAKIKNLKTGTQYYYRAAFSLSNGVTNNYGGKFKTKTGPRLIEVDGIYNVRDIGGYKTTDRRVVKQGLLFRGAELDGAVEKDSSITEQGVNEMVLKLGIKTELDLRSTEETVLAKRMLGSNVAYKNIPAGMYSNVFAGNDAAAMRKIFAELANPQNYPVYMHCAYGCDRTGTACYILGAFLGVFEDDLIKDYELSGLTNSKLTRSNIEEVKAALQGYSGSSLKAKAEDYLLSIGVTSAELASIRSIFLK